VRAVGFLHTGGGCNALTGTLRGPKVECDGCGLVTEASERSTVYAESGDDRTPDERLGLDLVEVVRWLAGTGEGASLSFEPGRDWRHAALNGAEARTPGAVRAVALGHHVTRQITPGPREVVPATVRCLEDLRALLTRLVQPEDMP
jgi:hypothetical protein